MMDVVKMKGGSHHIFPSREKEQARNRSAVFGDEDGKGKL
jgi:hypothetical protein